MERFSQRESVLLGYSPEASSSSSMMMVNHTSSSKAPERNSSDDIDFHDVFGGPPRRSSIHEMFYRGGDGEKIAYRNSWNGLSEKPVFGEEALKLRPYKSESFFNDIFGGTESSSSSPMKRDWDPSSSSSRVLSPARALPPKLESSGSPAQFSLPAKLTKAIDLPTFGSPPRSPQRSKDAASNGTSYYSRSRSASLNLGQDERNEVRSSHRQSLLSRELSYSSSRESPNLTKNDKTDTRANSEKESDTSEVVTTGIQFHFSIYKWASKGVPSVMPLRGRNRSILKENSNTEKCLSSDIGEITNESPKETKDSVLESEKQDNFSLSDTSNQESVEPSEIVDLGDAMTVSQSTEDTKSRSLSEMGLCDELEKEISVAIEEAQKPELKPLSSLFDDKDNEQGNKEITKKASGKQSVVKSTKRSYTVLDFSKNTKKQDVKANTLGSPKKSADPSKSRVKGKVKDFVKIFNQETSPKPKASVDSQNMSCQWKGKGSSKAEKEVDYCKIETDEKIRSPNVRQKKSLPKKEVDFSKTGTDEKIHIPNVHEKKPLPEKEADFRKTGTDEKIHTPNVQQKKSFPEKEVDFRRTGTDEKIHMPDVQQKKSFPEKEVEFRKTGTDEKIHMPNVHQKKSLPDASIMVDEFPQDSRRGFARKNTNYMPHATPGQKDRPNTVPNDSKATAADIDEPFQVKVLTQDDELPQAANDREELQAIDEKIRKWLSGKEGNMRSLLSTLQYVLWPESGWKPVPLVNIIEANAVKRSYQKALLCLHPDKLQQKGASSVQKYTAEKVFDVLQDAWTHFNSLGSM